MSRAPDPPEQEAAARALRRAGADPGRGAAARGGGSPDPEAQHRQPGAVRLRGARGDPGRHDPLPARGAGLQRLPGDLPGPHRGGALLPGARAHRRPCGRCLHRQRRLRADLDGASGVRGRRQRDPGARARLPALDRRRDPVRRHARALPLRRGERLGPRPRRHRVQDHRADPRTGHHQPQQPHRRRLQRGDRARAGRPGPAARPRGDGRRDLREDPLRRRGAPPRGDVRRRRRAVPDVQRALQGLPRMRLPRRLGDDLRPQGAGRPTSSRASP